MAPAPPLAAPVPEPPQLGGASAGARAIYQPMPQIPDELRRRRLDAVAIVVFHVKPEVRMGDFYGFGYLLPTLIAVKICNKERIAIVLMPALQVSLLAFVLGSGIGFGLAVADQRIVSVELFEMRHVLETTHALVINAGVRQI